jgi:tetratricopeptide (TPR) repeat protein
VGGGANRSPSFSSPGGAHTATRPSGGAFGGNRPSIQPGTRPPIGGGAAGISQRPAIGSGAGAVQRPAVGSGFGSQRPTIGAGVGVGIGTGIGVGIAGQRPATLPGLGAGGAFGDRVQNRPATRDERVAGLQNRMANAGDRMNMGDRQGQRQDNRGDRQQNRQDSMTNRQQDRQDYRTGAREDWQNWAGDHGDWYHGCWSGGWYPGAGWGYMWDNYPVAAALGVTWWGANRLSYAFGIGGYSNPYYSDGGGGYDYSEPIAAYQPVDEAQAAAPADPAAAAPPGVEDTFTKARMAFAGGNYKDALTLCNETLKTMPNDAAVHEFRALTQFALKNYHDAAAGVYAVLSAGPGWDWTTLSSLYGNPNDYTTQLRELEAYVRQNLQSSDGHFLLAYHYLTAGHADAANRQLKEVDKLTPNDKLVAQLLQITGKPGDDAPKPEPKAPPADDKLIKAEQLVGAWAAPGSGGSTFQLTLGKDSSFSWKFTSGKKSEEIKGVFAVEQNNLALEVSDGSVLLAEIELAGNQLRFKVIGGKADDPALMFKRSK